MDSCVAIFQGLAEMLRGAVPGGRIRRGGLLRPWLWQCQNQCRLEVRDHCDEGPEHRYPIHEVESPSYSTILGRFSNISCRFPV